MIEEIDIVEFMLHTIPNDTLEKQRIKLYLKTHKTDCNYYIFNDLKYKDRVICLTNIFKTVQADLCREVFNKIYV